MEPLFTWKDCANSIDDLKFSPDGSKLATASHDLVIDLYNARDSYSHIARCHGHSATVSHIDWSADGSIVQSNCNDYEVSGGLGLKTSSGRERGSLPIGTVRSDSKLVTSGQFQSLRRSYVPP